MSANCLLCLHRVKQMKTSNYRLDVSAWPSGAMSNAYEVRVFFYISHEFSYPPMKANKRVYMCSGQTEQHHIRYNKPSTQNKSPWPEPARRNLRTMTARCVASPVSFFTRDNRAYCGDRERAERSLRPGPRASRSISSNRVFLTSASG